MGTITKSRRAELLRDILQGGSDQLKGSIYFLSFFKKYTLPSLCPCLIVKKKSISTSHFLFLRSGKGFFCKNKKEIKQKISFHLGKRND